MSFEDGQRFEGLRGRDLPEIQLRVREQLRKGRRSAFADQFLDLHSFAFENLCQLFPMLTHASEQMIGSAGGAFWLFTVICILSFLFGWKMMPETKGRTLEEIARSWKKPVP